MRYSAAAEEDLCRLTVHGPQMQRAPTMPCGWLDTGDVQQKCQSALIDGRASSSGIRPCYSLPAWKRSAAQTRLGGFKLLSEVYKYPQNSPQIASSSFESSTPFLFFHILNSLSLLLPSHASTSFLLCQTILQRLVSLSCPTLSYRANFELTHVLASSLLQRHPKHCKY